MENSDIVEYLETVDLNVKMRGYDQIEVDEIFDRVCEEVKNLRENLKKAEERERIAEDHLDSEIKKITEKEKEVERILRDAELEATEILKKSLSESENLRSSTEEELRLLVSKEREELTNQLKEIETRHDEIHANIGVFEHQFSAHRQRILRALSDMQKSIEGLSLVPEDPNKDYETTEF